MIVEGRIIQMIFIVVSVLTAYWYIRAVKNGKEVTLRSMAALEAIDEAVGRAAEMGRPVHFTPGYCIGGLYHPMRGPGILAGLSLLKRVADSAARRGIRMIVTLAQAESIPIADEILRTAYLAHNLEVPVDTVRFISTEQYAYAAGVLGVLLEEQPGASFLVGYFSSESLQFAEGGSYIGAMQIGGTPSASQISFFIAACDYCLIGEELFAAKAYIDEDPPHLGSLMGQDFIRTIIIGLILLTILAGNLKWQWLVDLIVM